MKPDYPSPGYENHDGYGNECDLITQMNSHMIQNMTIIKDIKQILVKKRP